MELHNILPKQDDPQRLLALNGVSQRFWLSAEEINIILNVLARLLGNESALYKGEFPSVPHVEAEHPLPEPGSYAQIIVEGGTNKKASWDNTNKKWFLDGDFVPAGSDAAYLLRAVHDADNDGIIDLAKDIHAVLTAGGTKYYGTKNNVVGVFDFPVGSEGGTSSPTEIVSLDPNWQGGLNFEPVATFKEQGVLKNDSRPLTADPADPNFDRFDVLGIDLTVDQLKIIKGAAQDPPIEPSYDPLTFLPGKFILIKAGAAIPDGFVGVTVYNEGNEWQNTNAGPDFDRLNQESPAVGLYAIKVVSPLQNSQALPFVAPVPKTFEEGMKISYKYKNIVGGIHRWLVGGTKTNGRPGSIWIDAPFNYSASSLIYQALSVTIPAGILTTIDKISLVSGTAGLEYFVDDVKLVTGTEAVSGGGVTLEQMNSALALKVDKVVGYGLSQENFSPAEKTKLANVIELHKGTYTTITALRSAFPEGAGQAWHQNRGGWTGDVDAGTSANVVRYLWDASDLKWVIQQGETTAETAESIRTKYLSNVGTEEFTTTLLNKVNSITAIFTTALKTSYDAAATWVTTNGQNILDRLGVLERVAITVNTSRLLTANDHKRKLLITAPVTLTWPAGGITPFECNFDIDASGQLTIADQAGTPGADLDAPDGKILEAGKMAHAYKRPDNIKLRLKGTWKV